jgi:hypothetical protein
MKLKNIIQQLVAKGKTNNDSDDDCHSKITLNGCHQLLVLDVLQDPIDDRIICNSF